MNKIFNLFAVFCLLFNVMTSCKKEPPKVLPTISTSVSSNITSISAMSGGSITNDGGVAITARGVCWNTNQNPTISDNKTSDGTSSGSFTSSITGLTPGITYYVRAYATNIVGTAYGNQVSFTTTSVLPVLTTIDILNVSSTSATSGGIISSDGGAAVTERGVCWNTSPNPTITNNKTVNGTGIGIYTSSITNLIPGTTYYLRAYATNITGTSYGNEITFNTSTTLPIVTTTTASDITATTANSGGNITSDGGLTITARGVCWNTNQNPTITDSKSLNGEGIGSYASPISGLLPNTTYYLRAFATNSAGTSYGNQISFKTLVTTPTITTTTISEITATTASSGGNVTNDGGQIVSARGICWSTSQNPTTLNSKTINGSGTGNFSSSITGLTPGTVYYVRSYATNLSGTSYGNQLEFSTIFSTPLLTTVSVSALASISAIVSGNISHDGGKPIISSGICWSTTENPTVLDNKTMDGMAIGSFSGSLTGLYPNVTYYVRAYATNIVGTQYANQISFKTPSKVTDIDGNTYNTVIIGNQTWLKENLRTTKYNDGTPISNVMDKTAWGNLTIGAYVWYFNSILNKDSFGALYNWYSVDNNNATKVASNGGKNICPVGWHAPTDAEWTTLTNYLGGESGAAIKLKEIGVRNWIDPNTSATNSSGFTAIPGGYFYSLGFSGIGYFVRFWSTTEIDANSAWGKGMHSNSDDAYRNNYGKTTGFSVRCLKD